MAEVKEITLEALEAERAARKGNGDGRFLDYRYVPDYAEDKMAQEIVRRYGDHIRYVEKWGKWFIWDGMRWAEDETGRVIDEYVRRIVWSKANEIAQENTKGARPSAAKLLRSSSIHAVRKLVESILPVAATADQWDKDIWLLNTPGGVVDLRTGELREHRPDYYMTKITEVAPDANCPTPIFDKFLAEVLDAEKKEGYVAYSKRAFGYSLTGSVSEHAIFFGYGTGRNGKGVLVNTIGNIIGDYSAVAPISTFVVTKHEQHPTDLASLRGARFVRCSEVEKGHQWAEAKIKQLSGGDPIKARYMRQDFFEYMPQFKLFIIGNHKPSIRSVDEAIKGRMQMWPFDVFIEPNKRDKQLEEKLQAEWPGILAWMVEGCVEWQREGLQPPECVVKETDEYLSSQDAIAEWLEECVVQKEGFETLSALFGSWSEWAREACEYVGKRKDFKAWLLKRGFVEVKREKGIGFDGVWLKPPM